MGLHISSYTEIDGGKIYVEAAGEGEAVVLCHAGFVDSGMWDGQWDVLAQHYNVVRYDMRGYGKSDSVTAPLARREELYQLLKQQGIERAHLIGCSLGGETIIDFALEHPEMVASLVVVNGTPSGFQMQGELPPELLAMFEAMQQGNTAQVSDLQIRLWIDGPYRQPDQVDPAVRQRAFAMNRIPVERGTWAAEPEPVNPLNPPAVERLDAVRAPTLIVYGTLDHSENVRAAEFMARGIPGATLAAIEGAAHVPGMERPDEFNRVVLAFLQSIG